MDAEEYHWSAQLAVGHRAGHLRLGEPLERREWSACFQLATVCIAGGRVTGAHNGPWPIGEKSPADNWRRTVASCAWGWLARDYYYKQETGTWRAVGQCGKSAGIGARGALWRRKGAEIE